MCLERSSCLLPPKDYRKTPEKVSLFYFLKVQESDYATCFTTSIILHVHDFHTFSYLNNRRQMANFSLDSQHYFCFYNRTCALSFLERIRKRKIRTLWYNQLTALTEQLQSMGGLHEETLTFSSILITGQTFLYRFHISQ